MLQQGERISAIQKIMCTTSAAKLNFVLKRMYRLYVIVQKLMYRLYIIVQKLMYRWHRIVQKLMYRWHRIVQKLMYRLITQKLMYSSETDVGLHVVHNSPETDVQVNSSEANI